MRYAVRSLSCCWLFLVTATALTAEETKAPWWHIGRDKEATSAAPTVTQAPTLTPAPETITPIEDDAWFAWPSMPKWQWPHLGADSDPIVSDQSSIDGNRETDSGSRFSRFRFGKPSHETRPRNTWAQQPASSATTTADESTWQAMKSRTHDAWSKTVDFVTPDKSDEATVVSTKPRSSWWKRMWGSDQAEAGPQTVTEWMAQDRLDP